MGTSGPAALRRRTSKYRTAGARVEAAGAVDAQTAPTAPCKTTERFCTSFHTPHRRAPLSEERKTRTSQIIGLATHRFCGRLNTSSSLYPPAPTARIFCLLDGATIGRGVPRDRYESWAGRCDQGSARCSGAGCGTSRAIRARSQNPGIPESSQHRHRPRSGAIARCGRHFMELVEGTTLADRIAIGAVPIEAALLIANLLVSLPDRSRSWKLGVGCLRQRRLSADMAPVFRNPLHIVAHGASNRTILRGDPRRSNLTSFNALRITGAWYPKRPDLFYEHHSSI